MSKYKKIFSGLGLLSISTLIGASVVACANKKPKASDSSAEAIDQNNNQGNSTTPKDGENTPGNPTPETPKTPEKTPQQGDGSSNENSGNTNETDKKDKPGEGMKKEPEKDKKNEGGTQNNNGENSNEMTPKVTVEAKSMELTKFVDEKFKYPANIDSSNETKTYLKSKVTEIKDKKDATDEEKLKQLDELEKTFIEYSSKIEKYSKILEKGFELDANFPKDNKNGLNNRLSKLFSNDTEKKFTEEELIWQIYETIRPKGFEAKVNKYAIISQEERNKFITDSGITKIAADKKTTHGLNVDQLQEKINKMAETVILVAKKAADLNADKIMYKDDMKSEKPTELIKKIKSFTMKATTITEVDDIIAKIKEVVTKVKDIIKNANGKETEFKKKIDGLKADSLDQVKTQLDKIKA
ncbi:Vmc-like lipoprotein signal peptide domain-containing protein [Mycoplasmopsis cynos]|uniref:Vmc-like lipoprotein signal peptide domain-containing protein n=1 Tax=Mycoplasmopsis cynos TaxID=171284 RepID=UPI0030D2C967